MDIREFFEGCDLKPQSYSGRGMYGKSCLGVRVSNLGQFMSQVLTGQVDLEIDVADIQDLAEAFEGMKTDSLGLDMICYFPEIPWK